MPSIVSPQYSQLKAISSTSINYYNPDEGLNSDKNTKSTTVHANETSLSKILSSVHTYRIAQPNRIPSDVSSKFWTDSNQNNKVLLKFQDSAKSRPNTTNAVLGRTQSLPKFKNEML